MHGPVEPVGPAPQHVAFDQPARRSVAPGAQRIPATKAPASTSATIHPSTTMQGSSSRPVTASTSSSASISSPPSSSSTQPEPADAVAAAAAAQQHVAFLRTVADAMSIPGYKLIPVPDVRRAQSARQFLFRYKTLLLPTTEVALDLLVKQVLQSVVGLKSVRNVEMQDNSLHAAIYTYVFVCLLRTYYYVGQARRAFLSVVDCAEVRGREHYTKAVVAGEHFNDEFMEACRQLGEMQNHHLPLKHRRLTYNQFSDCKEITVAMNRKPGQTFDAWTDDVSNEELHQIRLAEAECNADTTKTKKLCNVAGVAGSITWKSKKKTSTGPKYGRGGACLNCGKGVSTPALGCRYHEVAATTIDLRCVTCAQNTRVKDPTCPWHVSRREERANACLTCKKSAKEENRQCPSHESKVESDSYLCVTCHEDTRGLPVSDCPRHITAYKVQRNIVAAPATPAGQPAPHEIDPRHGDAKPSPGNEGRFLLNCAIKCKGCPYRPAIGTMFTRNSGGQRPDKHDRLMLHPRRANCPYANKTNGCQWTITGDMWVRVPSS